VYLTGVSHQEYLFVTDPPSDHLAVTQLGDRYAGGEVSILHSITSASHRSKEEGADYDRRIQYDPADTRNVDRGVALPDPMNQPYARSD
jgi:hypothetical protein